MVAIDYSAIDPDSIELINSDAFKAVLKAHPGLRLVKVEEDEESYDEIFEDVTLPLPEGFSECLGVIDTESDVFMWVLYDDSDVIYDPPPALIDVLKVMDEFSTRTLGNRLFHVFTREIFTDSPEIMESRFDFAAGDYEYYL